MPGRPPWRALERSAFLPRPRAPPPTESGLKSRLATSFPWRHLLLVSVVSDFVTNAALRNPTQFRPNLRLRQSAPLVAIGLSAGIALVITPDGSQLCTKTWVTGSTWGHREGRCA